VLILLTGQCLNNLHLLRTFNFELYSTANLGKQGVILTTTYIHSRMESCATLANNDVAGKY